MKYKKKLFARIMSSEDHWDNWTYFGVMTHAGRFVGLKFPTFIVDRFRVIYTSIFDFIQEIICRGRK